MPKPKMMHDKLSKKSEPEVKEIGQNLYEVRSFSNPEIVYTVDIASGTCTCPAYEHRQVACKHIKKVQEKL